MNKQLTDTLFQRFTDLSFHIIHSQGSGHNETAEVVTIICQLLGVETAGLFLWDDELSLPYTLSCTGKNARLLQQKVNDIATSSLEYMGEMTNNASGATALEYMGQNISQLSDEQLLPEQVVLLFPLWSHHHKLGLMSFITNKDSDCPNLQQVSQAAKNFLLCIESSRKNRALQNKTKELGRVKTGLEKALKMEHLVQDKLELMAVDLKLAADQANKANKAKSNFLSSMSHELRTPMNAVLGFTQLLEMDNLTEDQRDNVNEILRAGAHLLGMIDELLELSKIESGKLEVNLTSVSLKRIIDRCAELIAPLVEEKSLSLSIQLADEDKLEVIADENKLRQVIINLLSNATKYNSEQGLISISYTKVNSEFLRINVADTGIGISAENQDKLFQSFERLGAETSAILGTGIGLTIAKSMIEAMDGKIGVDSVAGEGSCFWLELPYKTRD